MHLILESWPYFYYEMIPRGQYCDHSLQLSMKYLKVPFPSLHSVWSVEDLVTHWGRVIIYASVTYAIIGSDNGLLPGRHQAIIWTNGGILLIGPLGTNFNEILIEIYTFSLKKMHLKILPGKRWPFCLSLNELKLIYLYFFVDKQITTSQLKHKCLFSKNTITNNLLSKFSFKCNLHPKVLQTIVFITISVRIKSDIWSNISS